MEKSAFVVSHAEPSLETTLSISQIAQVVRVSITAHPEIVVSLEGLTLSLAHIVLEGLTG
jgi:hypothetical protein